LEGGGGWINKKCEKIIIIDLKIILIIFTIFSNSSKQERKRITKN